LNLVIDGSVALAWCFEDETTPQVEAIIQEVGHRGAAAPSLWRIQVANGLQMAMRRKRIDETYRDRALANLSALDIRIDAECDSHIWSATVRLAALYGLTVYDAVYLELAQRRRLPLATLDVALARAAELAGVAVKPGL
jgi:predicted nucleic acid-binding protein